MKKIFAACAATAMMAAAPAAAQHAVILSENPPALTHVQIVPGAKISTLSDFDRDRDTTLNPLEFAHAMMSLTVPTGAAGGPDLPAEDRYMHRGIDERMQPGHAVALLNATSLAFSIVDTNDDWRVSQQELITAALM